MDTAKKGWTTDRIDFPQKKLDTSSQMPTPRRYVTPTPTSNQLKKSESVLSNRIKNTECEAYSRLLKEKESICSHLTRTNAEIQGKYLSQTQELERLRSLKDTYEEQLKTYFAKNFEKQITERDASIRVLKEELEKTKINYASELSTLSKRLSSGQTELFQLRSQLQSLLKQQSKSNSSGFSLYSSLETLQSENQSLKEELFLLKSREVSRVQVEGLEMEFREVEEMQEKVIRENKGLKRQLEEVSVSEKLLRAYMHKSHTFLLQANFDLSQMVLAVRSIREGSEVNPAALLNSTPSETAGDLDSFDSLSTCIHTAKSSLSTLKSLLTEAYSDLCSSNCGLQ